MLDTGHMREWNQGIKDDVGVTINHPLPSLALRMARERQIAQEKKQKALSTLQTVTDATVKAISLIAGLADMTFNLYLSGGAKQQTTTAYKVNNEYREGSITPSLLPPPLLSSPILQAQDEDSRLTTFIRS